MKLAPIQLERYFLTEVNCQANPQFKTDQETRFSVNDLELAAAVRPIPDKPGRWQVSLTIKLQAGPNANSPYSFRLHLVGIMCWLGPALPGEKLEALLRTNGPSMLYGAARETVRDLTARGPFPPLVLPSVSFIPGAAKPSATRPAAPGRSP